ncbi:MAG: carboxypeptidase-like regulatory domain-containing protein [Cyclobacteriaceae bacterium]|nr:hypothetical protein [Cyclobacteriaceae bacterium]MCH8515026.1 carboxypeptidase-like regulatory domain-containing protein [Cyclobacteriaceae bacterium]
MSLVKVILVMKGHLPFHFKNYIKFFISFFFFFSISGVKAQDVLIFDSISQKPIAYAHISFMNTEKGTYSDVNGKFNLLNYSPDDSLRITHINFVDSIIACSDIEKNIYLKPNRQILNEVEVRAKKQRKTYSFSKRKKSYNYLNIPSIEIGLTWRNDTNETQKISSLSFSVKGGMDSAVVSLNIYSFSKETNVPEKLIDSRKTEVKSGRQTMQIDLDEPMSIFSGEKLFFSLELIGYLQNGNLNFKKYDKHKNALGYKMQKGVADTWVRVKNVSYEWMPASAWGESFAKYHPLVKVTYE